MNPLHEKRLQLLRLIRTRGQTDLSCEHSSQDSQVLRIIGSVILAHGVLMLANYLGIVSLPYHPKPYTIIQSATDYRAGLLSVGIIGMGICLMQRDIKKRSVIGILSFLWLCAVSLWSIFVRH